MGVWCMGLIFFYSGFSKAIGESWSGWSYLELFGFMVLMYGTFAYKGLTKVSRISNDK